MKLLLTSSGLSKRNIGAALQAMVDKAPSDCRVGFIPTAANVELGSKDWIIGQFAQLQRYGFYQIDIVDISAPGVDWEARLDEVDILWLAGGNTFHLLDQARKTGFDIWLKKNIDKKVYVGGSASSILMTPTIKVAVGADENYAGITDLTGLGYVDFEIDPHCDEAQFTEVETYANEAGNPVYALDDLSAIQVIDNEVTVISSGSWRLFNE